MYIFAHLGITLGAALGVSSAFSKFHHSDVPRQTRRSISEMLGLDALAGYFDIRFLLLGSMLPDIIDKPLAFLGFGNGRFITHTLLVTVIFLLTGFFISLNYKKTWLLAVAWGMCAHLILDYMWQTPQTLLWPIYSWSFPPYDHRTGLGQISLWWSSLIHKPAVSIPEGIGLIILLGLSWVLVNGKRVKSFLLNGRI